MYYALKDLIETSRSHLYIDTNLQKACLGSEPFMFEREYQPNPLVPVKTNLWVIKRLLTGKKYLVHKDDCYLRGPSESLESSEGSKKRVLIKRPL